VLISDESQIANCIYIVETRLVKDKRSLHIGIIEGELFFTDESNLHHKHIHSNNVTEAAAPAFTKVLDEISDLIEQST